MNNKKKKQKLSPEEIGKILGAKRVGRIGSEKFNPLSMQILATQLAERLVSKGGRPTDASWKISRKVPMKETTWEQLEELSVVFRGENCNIAPGQVAAIALERGIYTLQHEKQTYTRPARKDVDYSSYSFPLEEMEEAREMVGAVEEEGIW